MKSGYHIEKLTDDLFRREAGKLVAVLTKIFGTENFNLSEDVVQETFVSALQVWRLKGVPDNPSGWLFRVAKNKAIDLLRKNRFLQQTDFSASNPLFNSAYTFPLLIEHLWDENNITDDLLRLMFACCQPELSEESQVTLILKTLCGFSTNEIAKAFCTSGETISKRLYRAKTFFRESKIKPAFPESGQLKQKTGVVLKAIYLIFNEGYNSTHAEDLIREDLLTQALYLCKLLCDHPQTNIADVNAAMALMCFHASRINSRISSEGEIILLDHQDRTKWNRALIAEGNDYMNKAAVGDEISTYHLEAAIAYEHCVAASFEKTNWPRILKYYNWLAKINHSAIVLLNRLIIIYKINGAEAALAEIQKSDCSKEWAQNYLFHSLLGEIYASGEPEKAKDYFLKAIKLTQSELEKKLLLKKIRALDIG